MTHEEAHIRAAAAVSACARLDEEVAFFVERLGFHVEAVMPADDPREVTLAGHGLRLRLVRAQADDPCRLRLACKEPGILAGGSQELRSPGGILIELVEDRPAIAIPQLEPALVVTRAAGRAEWKSGRAGMLYRDLVPGRLGGRFVASHIRIPDGGPVADYVHHHRVRFQMIYCRRGAVRVVYEDQGPPFWLREGDCVLQPPEIRHRVLECSPGLEVVEIGCPAEHETRADPRLDLPNPRQRPERDFGGQRFVRHVAAEAGWRPWRQPGWECRDLGIARATGGLAAALVVRSAGAPSFEEAESAAEFHFLHLLQGAARLATAGLAGQELGPDDSCALPPGREFRIDHASPDLQFLVVTLPAEPRT